MASAWASGQWPLVVLALLLLVIVKIYFAVPFSGFFSLSLACDSGLYGAAIFTSGGAVAS